jgi:hypothetical protein
MVSSYPLELNNIGQGDEMASWQNDRAPKQQFHSFREKK